MKNNLVAAGWRVLVKLRDAPEKSAGGVVLPDSVRDTEKLAMVAAEIVDIGPDAWSGDRYTSGYWAGIGDWVLLAKFSGQRFRFENEPGLEYRLINDDEVLAVLDKEAAEQVRRA